MENEKNLSRENLYYGKVILYNHKEDSLKKERAILFSYSDETEPIYDLFYETSKYFTVATQDCKFGWELLKTRSIFEKGRFDGSGFEKNDLESILVYYQTKLNTLLEYFGFPEKMAAQDCKDMYKNLFNGKFAYENCALFGYQKKPALIWKNGLQVAREQKLDKYSMSSYDLVNENELTHYFEILNQIDYHDPEACFLPFEEEGQIRKRTL